VDNVYNILALIWKLQKNTVEIAQGTVWIKNVKLLHSYAQ